MSKGKAKVEIEDDKANKGFENAPKLFNKWNYDDIKVNLFLFRLKIPASSTILQSSPPSLKSSFPTPLEDIKLKDSEKHSAPLSKESLDLCNSQEETLAKKSRLSESSDTLLKSSTFLLEKILLKYWSQLFWQLVQEKIQLVLEQVVL